MGMVYPNIGFDALSARRQLAALAEEKKRSGKEPDTEHRITVKQFRIAAKAVGLELIAGLFLSCLDTPVRVRSPCRVFFEGGRAFPYYAAPCGNPMPAPTMTGLCFWPKSPRCAASAAGRRSRSGGERARTCGGGRQRRRLFCLMVSRLAWTTAQLDGVGLAEAQEAQEARGSRRGSRGAPTPSEVKYLVFDIEDIAATRTSWTSSIAKAAGKIQALTGDVLEAVAGQAACPDHGAARSGEGFHGGWAGAAFVEMLVDYAVRKSRSGTCWRPAEETGEGSAGSPKTSTWTSTTGPGCISPLRSRRWTMSSS